MKTVLQLLSVVSLPISIFVLKLTVLQALILCLCLFSIKYVFSAEDNYKYPPGPFSLPFVGQLLSILAYGMDEYFMYLHKNFGKMLTLKLGSIRNIVINDFDTIKEFGKHPEFQGRPRVGFMHELMDGYGIADTEGPLWKHQKRFVLHSLRDHGMGKLKMEEKITSELEKVTAEMKKVEGQAVTMNDVLEKAMSNVIAGLAFDKCFDYDDKKLISIIHKMSLVLELSMKLYSVLLFPWLRPFLTKDMDILRKTTAEFLQISDEFIVDHRKTLDKENPRDLIDLYLIEMDEDADQENAEYHETFSRSQLKAVIFELFGAGTETSSTTIRWAILYMLHHPDVQKKVQQEIDDVIGDSRPPTMHDSLSLPYTVATLQEVERLASVAPWTIPTTNQRPTKFREFNFPERCFFSFNLIGIHRDPKLWNDPEKFNPKRFIDKDGKVFRPPHLVSFGSGKRSCVGAALAKMEVFLFFVTLMQKFTFHSPDDQPPKIIAVSSVVRTAKPYKVIARSR